MSKNFSKSENIVLKLFKEGETFTYNKVNYKILSAGKPTSIKGAPKTDIYVRTERPDKTIKEFKVSFKQTNAHFIENKIMPDRAREILGENYKDQLIKILEPLKSTFEKKRLIFHDKFGNTDAGSITLGWRFEISKKESGELCVDAELSKDQILNAYCGTTLSKSKRNSNINDSIVENSGVANYIVVIDVDENTVLSDIISNMHYIENFIHTKGNEKLYFVFKALNYRSLTDQWEGNRCLAVYIDWFIENSKLNYNIVLDNPLGVFGHNAAYQLKNCLSDLNIENAHQLNNSNLFNTNIIYNKK